MGARCGLHKCAGVLGEVGPAKVGKHRLANFPYYNSEEMHTMGLSQRSSPANNKAAGTFTCKNKKGNADNWYVTGN